MPRRRDDEYDDYEPRRQPDRPGPVKVGLYGLLASLGITGGAALGVVLAIAALFVVMCLGCAGCLLLPRLVPQPAGVGEFPADDPAAQRAGIKDPLTHGWLTVEVVSVVLDRPKVRMLGGDIGQGPNESLVVTIRLSTNDPARRHVYRHWSDRIRGKSTLRDSAGNVYSTIGFGFGNDIIGAVGEATVTADRTVTDVFVYEKPVPAAAFVDLDLPESEVGAVFRFRLERAGWR